MLMDTSTHPLTLSLPSHPGSNPTPNRKKKLNFNTEYSGVPHEHEKRVLFKVTCECMCSATRIFANVIVLEPLRLTSCETSFGGEPLWPN